MASATKDANEAQNQKPFGPQFLTQIPDADDVDIFLASRSGSLDIIKKHVEKDHTRATRPPGDNQMPPMLIAATQGHIDVVKYFISLGQDPSGRHTASLVSGIHMAAKKGHIRLVREFLSMGVDVEIRDATGSSPLHYAAGAGFEGVMLVLLAHGADPNALDINDTTPIFLTAQNKNYLKCTCLLLTYGARVDVKNIKLQTPLHCAVFSGSRHQVRSLMMHGADYNQKDSKGIDPVALSMSDSKLQFPLLELNLWIQRNQNDPTRMLNVIYTQKAQPRFFVFGMLLLVIMPYTLYYKQLVQYESPLDTLTYVIFNIIAWCVFLWAAYTCPGLVERTAAGEKAYFSEVERLGKDASIQDSDFKYRIGRLCHVCKLVKPKQVSHDRRGYDRCIQEYDHFCAFMLNTIGRRNRRQFIIACLSLSMSIVWGYLKLFELDRELWYTSRGYLLLHTGTIVLLLIVGVIGIQSLLAVGYGMNLRDYRARRFQGQRERTLLTQY